MIYVPFVGDLLCSTIKLLIEEEEVEMEDVMDHVLQEKEEDVIIGYDL